MSEFTAIDRIKSVTCDPEGNVCIHGSDVDRAILQQAIADTERQLAKANAKIEEMNNDQGWQEQNIKIVKLQARIKELESERNELKGLCCLTQERVAELLARGKELEDSMTSQLAVMTTLNAKVKELEAQVKGMAKKDRWQSWSTVPDFYGDIIIAYRHDAGKPFTAVFEQDEMTGDGSWFSTEGESLQGDMLPTHWKPMPNVPAQEGMCEACDSLCNMSEVNECRSNNYDGFYPSEYLAKKKKESA